MDGKTWLKVAIFLCLIAISTGRELKVKAKSKHHAAVYNHTLATILVEYASAVYVSDLTELFTWTCSRCNDLTKGFQILELIVDVQRCLQAFVGVAQDLNAIVIAFRGTQESRCRFSVSASSVVPSYVFNNSVISESSSFENESLCYSDTCKRFFYIILELLKKYFNVNFFIAVQALGFPC